MKFTSFKHKILCLLPAYRLKLRIDALNKRIEDLTKAIEDFNQKNDYLFWLLMRKEHEPYIETQQRVMSSLPKATGDLRLIQLTNEYILKRLNSIAKQNNIHIMLGFGTLLGAIRHQGFIPWDDDIDVLVMRDDYEKLVLAIKADEKLKISTYYYYSDVPRHVIKVKLKETETFWVDIWICDKISISNTVKETWEKTLTMTNAYIAELENQFKQRYSNYQNSFVDLSLDKYMEQTSKRILDKNKWYYQKSEAICLGFEYSFWFRKIMHITNIENAFPLTSDIIFESEAYEAFRNPREWLRKEYGDYLSFPAVIKPDHQWEIGVITEVDQNLLNKLGIN